MFVRVVSLIFSNIIEFYVGLEWLPTMTTNGLGLCVRAESLPAGRQGSTKVDIITKVQLKNCC